MDGIAHAELEALENIKVVQVGTADSRPIHLDRLKQAGDTYHTGPGGGKLYAEELGGVQLVLPLEGNQAVFMMAGRAQTFAVGYIVILHDDAVHWVLKAGRIHKGNLVLYGFRIGRNQPKVRHHGKTVLCQKIQLLRLGSERKLCHQVEGFELQQPLF